MSCGAVEDLFSFAVIRGDATLLPLLDYARKLSVLNCGVSRANDFAVSFIIVALMCVANCISMSTLQRKKISKTKDVKEDIGSNKR